MPPIVLAAPGPLDARTGGYIYNRRITEGLGAHGWQVEVLELDSSFPYPTTAALEHADRALAGLRRGAIVMIDSLALGAMTQFLDREKDRLHLVALVHMPLAAAVGLDEHTAARIASDEARALGMAALVIVTGRATLPLIARYGVASCRMVVVEPGTDRPAHGRPGREATTGVATQDPALELLCVATVNAGKGHEMVLEALAGILHLPWRLTCAGNLTRDPATVARVRSAIERLRLGDRVSLVGELDGPALAHLYERADLFVLASERETYGMAAAEALAHGLPLVATMTGAIPELAGHDAGLLVPVRDAAALASALGRVLADSQLRARLAEGARRRSERLPTWDDAARRMAAALNALGLTRHG
jgi:glycosyltransferase involved in cell wall biosynthesis